MVNILAAARVASRWLQIDWAEAEVRMRDFAEADVAYVSDDRGWGAIIGADLRPLLLRPGALLDRAHADFRAGWRTDYQAPSAA